MIRPMRILVSSLLMALAVHAHAASALMGSGGPAAPVTMTLVDTRSETGVQILRGLASSTVMDAIIKGAVAVSNTWFGSQINGMAPGLMWTVSPTNGPPLTIFGHVLMNTGVNPVTLQGTTTITGTVAVSNTQFQVYQAPGWQGMGAGANGVTLQGTQTVTGSVSFAPGVNGVTLQGTTTVTGTLAVTAGGGTVWTVFPHQLTAGTNPVTLQGTQTITGSVSFAAGTNGVTLQGTQTITGSVSFSAGTNGVTLQGTTTVTGTLATTAGGGTIWTVYPYTMAAGTNGMTVQGTVTIQGTVCLQGAAATTYLGSVSLGNAFLKMNVMKTSTGLVTSSTGTDLQILTYTVTAGKTFYLSYLTLNVRLTTYAATQTYFGLASLETPSGTKDMTWMMAGVGILNDGGVHLYFPEPIPVAAGVVIRFVCTPSAVTSMTWLGAFGGYER